MTLRSKLASLRERVLSSTHCRYHAFGGHEPFVSVCFDDFPHTAYRTGSSILRNFGLKGTYYVALGLMNKSNGTGRYFEIDDLHSLLEDGHELASHTYSHISSRRAPLPVFRHDATRGREALLEMNLPVSGNFAYPYGEVTIAAKQALGEVMTSCRGIYGGINGPRVDLNLLRANRLYGNLEALSRIEDLLSLNEAHKGWAIFYTHDVSEHPSQFGCTPRLLEAFVSRALKGGNRILTIAEVLADRGLHN